MKKYTLAGCGIVAAFIVIANLGSLLALALSLLIAYMGFHYFRKTNSSFKKFFWGVVVLIGLFSAISNIPAFIGIIALLAMYYVWRKWNTDEEDGVISEPEDPFANFEREWQNITK